jgi:putative transposase
VVSFTKTPIFCNSDVLNQEFWLEKTFWSDGYFACSIGESSPDTIREYILNQG